MEVAEIHDSLTYVERGFAQILSRAEFAPVESGTGFVHLPEGTSFKLLPYKPFPHELLRIQRADIHYPSVVISNDVLLNMNTGYSSVEHIRQHAGDFPLREIKTGGQKRIVVAGSYAISSVERFCYLAAQPNYSAWLLGELPKLQLYREFGQRDLILLHGEPQDFHFDSLAMYGIDRDRICVVGSAEVISGANFLFASPGFYHHIPTPAAVEFLSERTAGERSGSRQIYVSRSRVSTRKIRNEKAMEKLLIAKGFEVVFPEKMSFQQQVSAFRDADVLVAPFGAALANLVYVRPTCKVLIITTKFTLEFARLMQMRGINFFIFNHLRRNWTRILVPRKKREAHTEFVTKLTKFSDAVDLLVGGETIAESPPVRYSGHKALPR